MFPGLHNTDGGTRVVGQVGVWWWGSGRGGMMYYDVLSRRGCLADKWGLFEGDEHGAHARHVFGLLAGLGVEVAEPGHPLPLCARVVLVQVRDHGLLGRPACNGRVEGEKGERTWQN